MRIIAGEARGRIIEAPAGRNTRPTLDRVRENIFNMIQGDVASSRVLDLFAGSGALSLEALSRGADFAVMVDHDRKACEIQQRNLTALRYQERARLIRSDWKAALATLRQDGERFGLVFLDPPYRMTDLRELSVHLEPLIAEDGLVVVEHEAKKTVEFGNGFEKTDERSWGFCGISFFRKTDGFPAGVLGPAYFWRCPELAVHY